MKLLTKLSVLVIVLVIGISQVLAGQYKPGTYKGTAMGRSDKSHSGEVTVEVTVDESKITDIKVVTYDQSVDHKKYGEPVSKAKTDVPAAILKSQALDAQVVADATMSANALQLAVARALDQARVDKYVPGTYKGMAMGRSDKKHTGEIEVEVTVDESKITDIKVVKYDQSVDHKKYGESVNKAKADIPAAIIKNQALGTDVIADATMSAVGIELAVARALEKAVAK